MNFRKQVQGKPPESGFGLMGYVITYGPWSSYNNLIEKDNWIELKWKIKGLKTYEEQERTWNLVLGYNFHQNDLFYDTFVFKVSRCHKSRKKRIRLLENTEIALNFDYAHELPLEDFFEKQQFGLDLSVFYPFWRKLFLELSGGVMRELIRTDAGTNANFQFWLVPKITF